MSQAGTLNVSGGVIPPTIAEEYVTNSGVAVPAANVLNVFGGAQATTSGAGNTLTITAGPPFAPNAALYISDDFIGGAIDSSSVILNSQLSWYTEAGPWNVGDALIESGHPGVIGNAAGGAGFDSWLFLSKQNVHAITKEIIIGAGAITLNWVIKLQALSVANPRYTLRLGLGDTKNADQANGVYFEYSDNINGGNWVYKTAASSVRTTSNSAIPATATWHNFQISINAAGTSTSFSVDGVSLGAPIATNIPTSALTAFIDILDIAGAVAANTIRVDLFYMNQVLTTAR